MIHDSPDIPQHYQSSQISHLKAFSMVLYKIDRTKVPEHLLADRSDSAHGDACLCRAQIAMTHSKRATLYELDDR